MIQATEKARSIFLAAVEGYPPEHWPVYLDGACGGDRPLRERVEQLLEAHRALGSLPIPGRDVAATVDQSVAEGPGTSIGPFKLMEQIGEGGMGVVFVAEQHQPMRRRVALKIIKPGMDTRQVTARFEAERQALAMMDHPNIARVIDAGATESGRPYFVMELVRGIPITDYCDREQLSIPERLDLFVLVCRAVQHAHQKGIIHRDLKPSNILVTVIDGTAVPKVIDFGVAKATGASLTDRTIYTAFQQFVGTPLYMSPEQADLSGMDVDTRSDIYSLGVLLYELLTGTTPFDQETFRQAAFDELRRIIREQEPPKPSTRLSSLVATRAAVSANRKVDARHLDRAVRGELDWIVMKALDKDRRRRYETASGFAADIVRYLTDRPVEACPPSAWYRFSKAARRNRAALVTTALVASALVLGMAVSTWQAIRASRAERRIAAALGEAGRKATEAQAVVNFLVNEMLASAGPSRARGRTITVDEVLARADTLIDGQFADQPLVEAAIRQAMGRVYKDLWDNDKAERHMSQALKLRRDRLGAEHPDTLSSIHELSDLIHNDGYSRNTSRERLEAARVLAQEALDGRRRVLGPEHPDTLASMTNLGFVLRVLRRYEEALALFDRAYEVQRRLLGPEHPDTLQSLHGSALMHYEGNRWDQFDLRSMSPLDDASDLPTEGKGLIVVADVRGVLHFRIFGAGGRRLVDTDEGRLPAKAPQIARLKALLGDGWGVPQLPRFDKERIVTTVISVVGHPHWDQSRSLFEQTLASRRRVQGPDHPSTLWTMGDFAMLLRARAELDEARSHYEEAQEKCDHLFGPFPMNYIEHILTQIYILKLQQNRIRPFLERRLVKLAGTEVPSDPHQREGRAAYANSLVWRLVTTSDPNPIVAQACVRAAGEAVELMPRSAGIWNTLGVAYYRAGDWNACIKALEKSEALEPDKNLALNGFFLAMARRQLGQNDQARA